VARKDCLTGLRTPIQWYLVLVGLIILGFQVLGLIRSGGVAAMEPGEIARTRLLMLGFAVGGPAIAGSAMAGSAFSGEGDNFALVGSWPVHPRVLFVAKAAAVLPVPLGASMAAIAVLTGVIDLGWSPAVVYLPVVALCLLPMQCAMTLVDLYFPDFAAGNEGDAPARSTGTAIVKRLIAMYGGIALIAGLVLSYGFGAYYQTTGWGWAANLTASQANAIGYAAFLVEATAIGVASTVLGAKRVAVLSARNLRGA
jgi:hypothetical protein